MFGQGVRNTVILDEYKKEKKVLRVSYVCVSFGNHRAQSQAFVCLCVCVSSLECHERSISQQNRIKQSFEPGGAEREEDLFSSSLSHHSATYGVEGKRSHTHNGAKRAGRKRSLDAKTYSLLFPPVTFWILISGTAGTAKRRR